jgi:hypothetical protein
MPDNACPNAGRRGSSPHAYVPRVRQYRWNNSAQLSKYATRSFEHLPNLQPSQPPAGTPKQHNIACCTQCRRKPALANTITGLPSDLSRANNTNAQKHSGPCNCCSVLTHTQAHKKMHTRHASHTVYHCDMAVRIACSHSNGGWRLAGEQPQARHVLRVGVRLNGQEMEPPSLARKKGPTVK